MKPSWCKDYSFLNKKPNIRERNKWFDQRKDTWFIVRWLKLHCFILLFRTLFRPLTIQDFLSISDDLYPEVQYYDMEKLRIRHPNWHFMWLCIRLLWWQLFLGAACGMIGAGLNYAGPKFINHIMDFIQNPNPTHGDQRIAYMYCGLWMMCYVLRMLFYQHAVWTCFSMSIKANQYVSILIWEKLMKMSYSYRRYLEQGDFMEYFNTDTSNVASACKSWYILFDAPTTLVTAQVFVYIAAHRYGVALTVIILFIMVVQIYIDWKRAKYTVFRYAHYQDRISMHLEFLQGFSACKAMGFEELLFQKQTVIRRRQNYYSKITFLLQSLYIWIVNFTPEFTIFMIFVFDLAISGTDSSFDTKTVYTLISYIGLIYSPLKSLPTAIINCIVAYVSFERMERLSKIEEVSEVDDGLPAGSLMLKNFVGAWEAPRDSPAFQISKHKEKEQSAKMSTWRLRHRERDEDIQNMALDPHEHGEMDFVMKIPFKIYLRPGERLILLGKNKSGKSSFFKLFLGQMCPRNGLFRYGGTLGFCPQVSFLQKQDAIRDNITFGCDYDVDRLNFAYDFVGLSDHLNNLEFYDEHYLSEVLTALHTSCRQRIPIARAVYYNPDIYLLDDIFTSFDTQSARVILRNFEQKLPNKTMVISSKNTHLIRPQDKVLIFDQGIGIEYGSYKQLLANPSSYVHLFKKHKDQLVDTTFLSNPDHMKLTKQLAELALQTRDHSMGQQIGKSKQYRKEFFIRLKERIRKMSPPIIGKRLVGVEFKWYKKFVFLAPIWMYILMVAMLVAGQTSNAFATWWIGHAKKNNWHLSSRAYIGVYTGLISFYALALLIAGIMVAYIGLRSADKLSMDFIYKTIMMDVNFLETQNKQFITGVSSRDNQQFWTMANYAQSVVSSLSYYVATCILSGYTSGYFFIMGGGMLVFNYAVVRNYLRAERETWVSRRVLLREYQFRLEDYILGTETFRAYNKVDRFRDQFFDVLHKFTGVYKTNLQWIGQARTMYAEMSGIALMFGSAAFAVGSKFRTPKHIAVIGSAISFSNRISSQCVSLVNDSSNLEVALRPSVKLGSMWVGAGHQKNYFLPHPPPNWPEDGSIHIENVSLKIGGYMQSVLNNLSIDIPSGSKVAVYEKIGCSSVLPFLALINRFRLPTPNLDKSTGFVTVGGKRIDKMSARDIRQSIMLIDSFPFVFSGTIRENMDPFSRYSDERIKTALQKTGLWDQIPVTESETQQEQTEKKLDFLIIDGGEHMGEGRKQLFNFSRIILYKPPVVLCNYAASALNSRRRFALWNMMLNELPDSTLIVATEESKIFLKFHTVIYIEDGLVKEVGRPLDLLNEDGKFSEAVQMMGKALSERPSRG